MDLGGISILWVIIAGIVIGFIARAIKPGPQKIGFLWTALLGAVGALIGWIIASAIGVAETGGGDWIRWLISIVVAIILIGIYMGATAKKGRGGTISR